MLQIQENVLLKNLTSFRIGGPSKFLVEIFSKPDLAEALNFAREKQLPWYVLGSGTNLLVADQGFIGVIFKMKMNALEVENQELYAEAGVPLIKVINFAAQSGLAGLENCAGIPGTFGGAVRGNAGAYAAMIGDKIKSVLAYDSEKNQTIEFSGKDCQFEYRSSFFKKNPKFIILGATLLLEKTEPAVAKEKIKQTIQERMTKELNGVLSAGSFFMNPVVENKKILAEFEKEKGVAARGGKIPAGWLIEQADLKGKKIGQAMVSEKHANYLINTGEAKAEEVMILVSYLKQQVRDKLGVELQEEVNYLGF